MQKIEIVARVRIDGVYHIMKDLPKEDADRIIEDRIDTAMRGINFERKKPA